MKNTSQSRGMPAQKIPLSKKTEEWHKQCTDAVIAMASSSNLMRTNRERKKVAYDLINSIFDEKDVSYVLDPYSQGSKAGQQPAKMRNMNLIVNKFNLLRGEELNRPFYHRVVGINGGAISAREDKKKELMFKVALTKIAEELGVSLVPELDPETGEPIPVSFNQIDKFLSYSYSDIREKMGNSILLYLRHKEKLESKFLEGWEHALAAAEEIYYVGIINGEPKLRVVNPLNFDFDRNPDNPLIEKGDWFKEERWMTAGQILDEYNEFLTDAQIQLIDSGNFANTLNDFGPEINFMNSTTSRNQTVPGHYLVSHVVWKSMKRIGIVTYPMEDKLESGVVDETFVLTLEMKKLGYSVEWREIPEFRHATKVGADIYLQMEVVPNQTRSMDNPSEVEAPYIGRVYNAINSMPTSFVDLIKPHQYLYNVIWFRLEAEIAKAKGKKMVMDIAQIPKSEGIDIEKWMYFFDNVGVAFVNSFEEGKEKFQGQTSNFNQFSAIDMTLSASIGQYIGILGKIEQMVDKIVGISPQREGGVHQSETATGAQTAVSQSSQITEPWFFAHNQVKTQVLSRLLETAKFAFPGKKKIHYILDDVERVYMELDMEKFSDSDYGVFVSNSIQDNSIFNKLSQLIPQGISTGAINFSDAIAMFKSQSTAELSILIKESEKKREEIEAQKGQMQEKINQANIDAAKEKDTLDKMFIAEQNQLDRENALQKTALSVTGFDTDTADNGVLDVLEQSKFSLEESKENNKNSLERLKLSYSSVEKDKDRKLKEKEIASKEKIEKLKAETALKNKVAGEK